jgi:hypothetical protein
MTVLERNVEQAVGSAEDIRWFGGYLRGLIDSGVKRSVLEATLKRVYLSFRDDGDERSADLVLDGLDLVTGWCGPGMAIPDRQTVV